MRNEKLSWCFGLRDGLRIAEPSERLAKSYLNEARSSLHTAEKNFLGGDMLWTTVVLYYAEYYALYAFLQRIGIKCENHFCSILAVSRLLGKERVGTIIDHKSKRIDAQYYMKTGKRGQVEKMLCDAKVFVSWFDRIVSNLSQKDIEDHRHVLKSFECKDS